MGDTKEFSINWPNRIKYEKEGDFKNSLFSDIYKKAEKYVRDIIEDNGREKRPPEQEAYCNDENFNNIIPFLVREEWVRPQRWYPLLYHCRRVISI